MEELTKSTYALVVAIEYYPHLNLQWQRNNLNAQAAVFVKWLLDRGVPPSNIKVFRSTKLTQKDDPFEQLSLPENAIEDATKELITKALKSLRENCPNGTCLMVYWVGHGFVDKFSHRRLLLADALENNMTNLDLESVLGILKSAERGNLQYQFGVFDACAQVIDGSQFPEGALAVGQQLYQGLVQQEFYFAVPDGKFAVAGVFGPAVLRALEAQPEQVWPPTGISGTLEKELNTTSHLPVKFLWTSKEAGGLLKEVRSGSLRYVYANIILFLSCFFGPVAWIAFVMNLAPWAKAALIVLPIVWIMIPLTPLAQYLARIYQSMFGRQFVTLLLAVVFVTGLGLQLFTPITWAKSSAEKTLFADLVDVEHEGRALSTDFSIRSDSTPLFAPFGGRTRNMAIRTNRRIFLCDLSRPDLFPWLPGSDRGVLTLGTLSKDDELEPRPIILKISDQIPKWDDINHDIASLKLTLTLTSSRDKHTYVIDGIKPAQTIRFDIGFLDIDPRLEGNVYLGQLNLISNSRQILKIRYNGKWTMARDPEHENFDYGIDLSKAPHVGTINWNSSQLCTNHPEVCQ